MSTDDSPRPEEYQPALTWWSHTWRILVMALIGAMAWLTISQDQVRLILDIACGVPAVVLVFFRRRWPMTVAVVTALLASVSALAAGPATLAAVSLATRRNWGQIVVIGVLSLITTEAFARVNPVNDGEEWWVTLIINTGFISAVLAWGMYIGSRRELLWTLRARAERAEAEQELRAGQSRLEERGRIAREMHDVLAHRISQISMRAGALGYRDDLDASDLRAEVAVIHQAAHQALTDLRAVLGVLRDDEGAPMHAPQPTYADLDDLVSEARESGMRIEFHDQVTPDHPVPEATGRTLYRIVQEGITNARKHAPSAELRIDVAGDPDEGIEVVLCNPLGFGRSVTPGAGLGLIGLAERATLRGGTVEHASDDGEFRLRGWIPWTA